MIFSYYRKKARNVNDVVAFRNCVGCGVCYYICPEKKIKLLNIKDGGIRPIISSKGCGSCSLCLKVCPGINTNVHIEQEQQEEDSGKYWKQWGYIKELYEGYSSDPVIRLKGSSGGLCTALSAFAVERGIAGGVLSIGEDPKNPWENKTYRSTKREELIGKTGSRYSPATPCSGLDLIDKASDKSVFIGKPCDVAGLRMAQRLRPELSEKITLTIGFFCAGTPSIKGTLELLKKYNVKPEEVAGMRYRGMGWPGNATVIYKNNREKQIKISYRESWGFLQKYRPFRCYLCPDLTAEFADISVGDPWYREISDGESGRSLIIIRTKKGKDIFNQAIKAGYIAAERVDHRTIYQSQKNLLSKRQAIWGRLLALKILGIPHPKLYGFHLFENWMDLTLKEKIKSVLGTGKRIIQRNYFKPLDYSEYK